MTTDEGHDSLGQRIAPYGRSHEFADRSQAATAETKAIYDGTKAAVDRFFGERGGPLTG